MAVFLYPLHPPATALCLPLRISTNPITIIVPNLSIVSYQAAFFTPGIFPASAFIRKLYCEESRSATMISQTLPTLHCSTNPAHQITYPRHLEIPQHTPSFATFNTPISNLRRAGIAMHLRQLQLRLGARPRGQGKIADDVSKRLPIDPVSQQCASVAPVDPTTGQLMAGEVGGGRGAYRSGSCSAKTLRLVWSRITLTLTKQPRSSFLALNIDMLADYRGRIVVVNMQRNRLVMR